MRSDVIRFVKTRIIWSQYHIEKDGLHYGVAVYWILGSNGYEIVVRAVAHREGMCVLNSSHSGFNSDDEAVAFAEELFKPIPPDACLKPEKTLFPRRSK